MESIQITFGKDKTAIIKGFAIVFMILICVYVACPCPVLHSSHTTRLSPICDDFKQSLDYSSVDNSAKLLRIISNKESSRLLITKHQYQYK